MANAISEDSNEIVHLAAYTRTLNFMTLSDTVMKFCIVKHKSFSN